MQILLTQPITSFIQKPPCLPDLGLGYLAAHLRDNGFEVLVHDWNMPSGEKNFRALLQSAKIDMVGIKVFTKDIFAASRTVAVVREELPNAIIVLGGPHPSCSNPDDLILEFPEVDIFLKGPAEHSLSSVCQALVENRITRKSIPAIASSIAGTIWQEAGVAQSTSAQFELDMDALGFPAWDLIDPRAYGDQKSSNLNLNLGTAVPTPVVTTRGCTHSCTFCSVQHINGRSVWQRSVPHVIEELKLLYHNYGVRNVLFMDNCFTVSIQRVREISQGILDAGLDIEWDCNTYGRPAQLDDDTVELMYRSGCRMVQIGIESASERVRKNIHKNGSLDKYRENSNLFQKHNIAVGAWFMIGFPNETIGDIWQTVRYAFSLGAKLVTFSLCFPLPGSEVNRWLKEKYKIKRIDWTNFNIEKSPYPISCLSSILLTFILKSLRLRLRLHNLCYKLGAFWQNRTAKR